MDENEVLKIINSRYTTKEVCSLKHKEVEEVKETVDRMSGRLWAILILLCMNLAGLVAWFIKG